MLFLRKGWNNKIKVKKTNDRNLDYLDYFIDNSD